MIIEKTNIVRENKQPIKLTISQRLNLLLDANSFFELDAKVKSHFLNNSFDTDGVITGFGAINNKKVAIYAQDFSLKGGSVGKFHAEKICKIMDHAARIGCPIIGLIDSGGARIEEGIHALAGYGEIFSRNVKYSGIIPQISIILGPCAGGATYSPALTDFIFTTKNISNMFITGPNVIEQVLHQTISKQDLGGAFVHNKLSGVAHFISSTEQETFLKVKELLEYLPYNYLQEQNINIINQEDFQENFINFNNLKNIVPENFNQAYNIKNLINNIFDQDSFLEIQELFAQNIVIGFAKLSGINIAVIANQPAIKAGSLDIDASCKASRFINFCNTFNIPIITLVDVPGFLPGIDQEHNGIIRHGAKLIYAYAQATVPKITVILRKAFGGAYIVMGSKHLGADFNFAWENSQIAVLGAKGAVSIIHNKKLNSINNLQEKELLQNQLEKDYEQEFLNPNIAAQFGYIDSIITPEQTREYLIKSLKISLNKVQTLPKKKMGNGPL